MPMYLKRETIRLLEASVSAISMAVAALGLPQRHEIREPVSENAIAIGLAGISAELAMSSIIVQAQGNQSLVLPSGFYKTGKRITEDFKNLISSQVPKMVFLTQGIDQPTEHISALKEASAKFKLLTTSRAGGLHAGIGPSRDVCITCVNDVISFLGLLGKSSRIKPYTETVPRLIEVSKSFELIVDELIAELNGSVSDIDRSRTLASVYLVVPELPDKEPEWIDAFDRLLISPKRSDISFLLDTLKESKCASLVKVASSNAAVPVVVQKGNPSALPIEPQYLKKSFSDIRDQWYADRGVANGRLDKKQFDPPPIESVYEIFTLQFHTLQITDSEEKQLTAVDTWPLIASSLTYSGTLGPYWYFVRKTSDLGQLDHYIDRVVQFGCHTLKPGVQEYKLGVEAIRKDKPLSRKEMFVKELLEAYEKAEKKREVIMESSRKHNHSQKELSKDAKSDLKQVLAEEMSIGEMLVKIVENEYCFLDNSSKLYWARVLSEAASEIEDTHGLLAILKTTELSVAHTAARKALRVIDFVNFGPRIE